MKDIGVNISKKELREVDGLVRGFQTNARNIGLDLAIKLVRSFKHHEGREPTAEEIIKGLEFLKTTDIDKEPT